MFSFIIPTINEGNYIGGCLASIKKQTRKDYEIIIVDIFSRDGTARTARRYGAKVIFVGRSGIGLARNIGARASKGDILIFADADVRFEKDFLEMVGKKFEKSISGGVFKLKVYDADTKLYAISYIIAGMIVKTLNRLGIGITGGSCYAFDKKIFDEAGGFDEKFFTNEDQDLANRIMKIRRFVFFDDIIVNTSCRRIKRKGFLNMVLLYVKLTFLFFLEHGYMRYY